MNPPRPLRPGDPSKGLVVALWPQLGEDPRQYDLAVVRCIMSRCRLLGLEGPSILRVEESKPRTLVVPPVT